MNNLDLLAEAAEYVERSSRMPVSVTKKEEPYESDGQPSFHCASSWPATVDWPAGLNGPIRKQYEPSMNSTRAAHNVMEKNRRAFLRRCMECLRSELPIADGQRCTTLFILAKARRYVDLLEREAVRLERERATLQNANRVYRARLRSYSVSDDFDASGCDVSPTASSGDIPQATAALARIQLLPNVGSSSGALRGAPFVASNLRQVANGTGTQPRPGSNRRRCVTLGDDYVDCAPTRGVKPYAHASALSAGAYRLRPKRRNISTPNGGGRLTPPSLFSYPSMPNGDATTAASRRLVSVLKPLASAQSTKSTSLGYGAPASSPYLSVSPIRSRPVMAVTTTLNHNHTDLASSADADGVESESAVFADGDVDMVDVSESTLEYAYTADSSPDGGEAICGVIEIEVTSGSEPQPAMVVLENDDNSSNDSGVSANS